VVEMAIVLPLLLTLMFAIGEFGIMFTQYQTLINAARRRRPHRRAVPRHELRPPPP